MRALIEANPPGAIQAASDSFLRQAIAAVCAVEPDPTLWHVYRMLSSGADALPPVRYTGSTGSRADFARNYWHREFPALLSDRGFAAQALNPPRNKIERLISTREIDLLLRHPHRLDLAGVIEPRRGADRQCRQSRRRRGQRQARHATAARASPSPDPSAAAPARAPAPARVAATRRSPQRAHDSVATMLAEGRSAGLEAVFAWQYSAQIADDIVRSGVRSLLQSISIFRMREIEDARSLAGLAMDVYSDRISVDQDDQQRLRFSADDITRLQSTTPSTSGSHTAPPLRIRRPNAALENLHDPELAERHLDAQRARGAHCPAHLSDPLAARPEAAAQDSAPPARRHRTAPAAGGSKPRQETTPEVQLELEELKPMLDRQLHRRPPLRPRPHRDRHRTEPRPAAGAPARPRDRPRRLALQAARHRQLSEFWWPGHSQHAARRLTRLFRAGTSNASAPTARAAPTPGSTSSPRQDTDCCTTSASSPPAPFKPRDVFDYGHALHDLHLNAWVLAYRRHLGPTCSSGRAKPVIRRAPARQAQLRLDDNWTPKDSRPAAHARSSPTPCSRSPTTTPTAAALFLIEYDRTTRIDKNYDKFRRYDAFLAGGGATPTSQTGEPPCVLFVCQDEAHRDNFLDRADRELTGHHWHPGEHRRPARIRRSSPHPLLQRTRRSTSASPMLAGYRPTRPHIPPVRPRAEMRAVRLPGRATGSNASGPQAADQAAGPTRGRPPTAVEAA